MEDKYLLFTLNNGTGSLKIGCGQTIKVIGFSGLEAPDYIVHTSSNAAEDGTTVTGKKVDERIITISFGIDEWDNPATIRRQVERFMNPKRTFDICVNYIYNKLHISGELEDFNWDEMSTLWETITGTVRFKCPSSYWMDMDNFGKNIAAVNKQFTFPLGIVTFTENQKNKTGKIMSYNSLSDNVVLHNKGDVPCGVQAQIVAKRGTVKNPKLINRDTGQFIEVICDMAKDDELFISTTTDNQKIELNGNNIFKQKNKLSEFFKLSVGDNVIAYDAAENRTNLDVRIYYTPNYLGV